MKGTAAKILFFFLAISQACTSYASKTIYIIYPENLPKYKEAATEIEEKIKVSDTLKSKESPAIKTLTGRELKAISPKSDALFISLGSQSISQEKKDDKKIDIIYSFVKRDYFLKKERKQKGNWSAIFIDQPIGNLIEIAEKTIQNNYKDEILIVTSKTNKKILHKINQHPKLNRGKLKVVLIKDDDNTAKLIEKHLFNAAALIAVHDKKVWSNKNARWILHQAYSYKVPVIGYSEAFLKAGAMASAYSSIEHIAEKTSEEAIYWINSGKLRNKALTPDTTIKVNKNIAKALGYSTSIIEQIEREL